MVKKVQCIITASLSMVVVGACTSPAATVPASTDPFVYVVLDPAAVNPFGTRDQYAVVLTTGSPLRALCRDVQRFAMQSGDDGRPFAWRIQSECTGGTSTDQLDVVADSCCTLPENVESDSLGSNDFRGGERYNLEIISEGATISGSLLFPDTFSIRVVQLEGARRAATWPHVEGAAAYLVDGALLTDTLRLLPPEPGRLDVLALDANLYAYLRDQSTDHAGVEGARGVFGAVRRAGVTF